MATRYNDITVLISLDVGNVITNGKIWIDGGFGFSFLLNLIICRLWS